MNYEELINYRFPRFEQLPDIELYPEQAAELINRYIGVFTSFPVTQSSLRVYEKLNVVSPLSKKRYSREQVASFIMIRILEKVFDKASLKSLFEQLFSENTVQEVYVIFCELLEKSLRSEINPVQSGARRTLEYAIKTFTDSLKVESGLSKHIQNG